MREIVFTSAQYQEVRARLLADHKEVSLYALIGRGVTKAGERLLVRELIPLEEKDYDRRTSHSIQVKPEFINRVAGRCEREGLGLLMMHSHPFEEGDVWFSPTDDRGEERVLQVFNDLGGGAWPLASLVLAQRTIKARVWSFADRAGPRVVPVDRLRVLGQRIQLHSTVDGSPSASKPDAIHDRQVRAFGAEGQARIADLTVAIIGAGGTGSACFEMLVRLGVGHVHLIDNDTIEDTNVSRIYGSTLEDIDKPKAVALAVWSSRVSRTRVTPHVALAQDSSEALKESDIILSCTDTESSRAFANQLAYQYMIPMIDMGNRIAAAEGHITAASARLTILTPGEPCLDCYGSIQHDRVRAELLPVSEYKKLQKEGYVEDLNAKNPSVISLNSLVASLAITRLLDMVTGAGGPPWNKWTFDYLTGELRPATVQRRSRCICRYFEATGDMKPLPFGRGDRSASSTS